MEEKAKKRAGLKTAIVILSVLLAISIIALAGLLIFRSSAAGASAEAVVPDNIISPDAVASGGEKEPGSGVSPFDSAAFSGKASLRKATSQRATSTPIAKPVQAPSDAKKKAAVISLHQRQVEDNQPFHVRNLFPGDAETKYFCVKVSHSGDVVVRYHADIRPGSEKLAEVLRCRIVLLTTGETLYDGLMRDMPESLNHSIKIKAGRSTESELYYEITAYLDTSVGNDYQNKDLIADFRWWVEDKGSLTPPHTGDSFRLWPYIAAASVSLVVLLLLWKKRRKEVSENG